MTDFYAQLERQLVDAGRRRESQGHVRRVVAGRARLAMAAGAAVLALAAGGALVPGLLSGTGPATGGGAAPPPAPPAGAEPAPTRSEPLRGIYVAVLNATTRGGLARTVAELLERRGATLGVVSNAPDQSAAQTVVAYAEGMQAPAREVAAVLGVDEVVPFQGPSPLLGNARPAVIVMVGRDRVAP